MVNAPIAQLVKARAKPRDSFVAFHAAGASSSPTTATILEALAAIPFV